MYYELLAQSGFSMERLAGFCAVADAGSIAGVAKNDPSRQALISRQIRELEMFFGVELVRRRGRGLELTEAGRELAAVGRQNFKGLSDFAARVRSSEWLVRLVASNSVAQWLVLPRLHAVARASAGVRFEVHHEQTGDMVNGIREGIFDIALIRKDALVPGIQSGDLGEVTHSIFVPKALLNSPPRTVGAALKSLPMALPIGGRMRDAVDKLAPGNAGVPKLAVACSSYLQAVQLVRSGMCAAALPDLAADSLGDEPVHRLKLPVKYTLCLAWTARNTDTSPALAELLAGMLEELKF